MSDQRYYHGGAPSLRWRILPPSESGVASTITDYIEDLYPGVAPSVVNRDRVYVATNRDAAALYAMLHPAGGWLYEVEPQGELESDPDWLGAPGVSLRCPWALIVRVAARFQVADGLRLLEAMA